MPELSADPVQRAFLGVERSATGQRWISRLDQAGQNRALAIAQTHGLPELTARVLAGRGVGLDDAVTFLDPTLRGLMPDPLGLADCDKAADRLVRAIRKQEKIAIFGDYDVDGAASSALMHRFLAHFGIDAPIYIPDRIFEGYGPNPNAINQLIDRGAQLIVTVDCGSTSNEALQAAADRGIDVVVIDHHQMAHDMPVCHALVNPNREDDLSGQGHLCAAGVVFLVLVATAKKLREAGDNRAHTLDLLRWLDLVALATVCDVVPLTGVNRAFVVKGLQVVRQQRNVGLAALTQVARIGEPVSPFHLAFLIGPRINAGGRIGDAALGSRLLATDDPVEARTIAETLDRLNQERQAMEQEMLAEARAEADAEIAGGAGPAVLVTASDRWHPGIVGLLASRLKDHARRPAFAVHFNANGTGTGSGRSITGFDLGRLVRAAAEAGLLVKGGGHAMAAGITVERDKLGALRAFFEEHAAQDVFRLQGEEALSIDAALAAEGATLDLLDSLEKAGPFGAGHVAPVFVLPRHRLVDARLVGTNHIRAELQSQSGGRVQAIAFRAADTALGDFLLGNRGQLVHVAGSLSGNYWNGNRTVQLRIIDAALA